ncbi:uncharacterized protein LOC116347411 isoform X1 [Contarinia nasturtii]|uniref:uncharacterized protein LOC116347411 isoform X1 n=1 Tax=Contarinia nasturtii TaxID=265458 RepID=UPI0012D44FAE|nr:uncharacterized protein LOC116347411 isoform X1 [Contarinia nasturtii]
MGSSNSTSQNVDKSLRKNRLFKQSLKKLHIDRNKTGDVSFNVNSEIIYAHRCILAALSSKHKDQFYGIFAYEDNIKVADVTATDFDNFLKFFYCNKFTVNEISIEPVLKLLKQSFADDFADLFEKILLFRMNKTNLHFIYRMAITYELINLKEICKKEISIETMAITDSFINCTHEVLIHILKINSLNYKEMKIFDACIAWARNSCLKKNKDDTKAENLRTELGDAIYQIRFCSMSIEEFTNIHRKYPGFFLPDETNEIFYSIANVKDQKSHRFIQTPRVPCVGYKSVIKRNDCAYFSNPIVAQLSKKLYLDRNETGDIIFIVHSKKIYAHRCVLAALSPKYETQFYGSLPDKDVITVDGVSSAAFEEFLQFFYLDELTMSIENIGDVLYLAQQSLVDDLVKECQKFLLDIIAVGNVCRFYKLAIFHNLEIVREFCEQTISLNAKKVFVTDDFMTCDRNTLISILKLHSLDCEEMKIFDACISWAKACCKAQNNDDGNIDNLRAELGDALYQIRFSFIKIEEFAKLHKTFEGLFSPDESNELFYLFGKLNEFSPKKFNQTRRSIASLTLQCDRTITELDTEINRTRTAQTRFTCNVGISLEGLILFGIYDTDFISEVVINKTVKMYNNNNHNLEYLALTFTTKVDKKRLDKEIVIKFKDSITFKAYEKVDIVISYYCCNSNYHSFQLANNVELNDKIVVIFEGNGRDPTKCLLFKLLY